MPEWIKQLDTASFFFINLNLQNGVLDSVMPFITNKWYLPALLFVFAVFLNEKTQGRTRRLAIILVTALLSVLLSDWINNILKNLIGRERPCNVLENVHLLAGCTKSFSMPSNHAANSFAFAVPFLLLIKNRLKYALLLIALLVGFSRVYVGVHYPSDVIAGAITGTLTAFSFAGLFLWAERRFANRPYTTVMIIALLFISLFRIYYILHGPLDLGPDEAHYWEWSRRLDLSYYSKGPVIAYLIAFGTALFGNNVFGIRILAVVFSVLSSVVLFKLGSGLFNERTGVYSAVLYQIIPLFSPFGVIFTIDSPFLFFWILSLYLFWKAVNRDKEQASRGRLDDGDKSTAVHCRPAMKIWLLLGIAAGLGLLTKYTMAFFYICSMLFLLSSPDRRGILRTPYPYAAFTLSLALFSPVIIWNAQHDWVTLLHTSGQAHIAEGFRTDPASFLEFAGSQIGVVTPVLFVMMLTALFKLKSRAVSSGSEARGAVSGVGSAGFLLWFSMPVLAFFFLKSLQGKVQANWAMTGYITGIIAFSKIFLDEWGQHKKTVRTLVTAGLAIAFLLTAFSHYPAKFNLPAKLDPSARLRGWKELGREVSAIHSDMLLEGKVFILSDRYQVSSELAFYVRGNPIVYSAATGRRMNQYDIWPGFENFIHYNAIFVTIGDTALPVKIRDSFKTAEKRLFKVYEKGKILREYSIFMCYDFKGMARERTERY